MPNNMSRLCFMMMAAVVAVFGVFAASLTFPGVNAQAQDYSRAYRYGGGINIPGAADVGSGAVERDIVNVNAGIDVGGVLGCSGLDLKGMIKNTFEVGDLGAEFKDYLKNTLATEALSLLYSQPGVSQVLDGMKAIGHARASILQERCNANEILADVTNQRVKSEAYMECVDEHNATYCDDTDNLSEYVEDLMDSARWSGTLHDKICPADEDGNRSASCDFIPNFAYNINDKEGKRVEAKITEDEAGDIIQEAALECLQERGQKVSEFLDEVGVSQALDAYSTGEAKLTCGDVSEDNTGGENENNNGSVADGANAGLSAKEQCEVKIEDNVFYAANLDEMMRRAQGIPPEELLEKHVQCLIGKELHAHVDVMIATMSSIDAFGVLNALSDVFRLKAVTNFISAKIKIIADTIIESGGPGSTRNCEVYPDNHPDPEKRGKKVNPECVPSMTPQELDAASAEIQALRAKQQSALADLEAAERLAERVDRMNQKREKSQENIKQGMSKSAQIGASADRASKVKFYKDYFGQ